MGNKENKKEFYDSLPGNYVKCNFCQRDYLFLSKSHIFKCSNGMMTYEQYIEKFGRQAVWSEKYSHLMKGICKEAGARPEVIEKLKNANKKYYEEHKEEVLKRTEKMRNSPNRLKNLLENYQNMSEEEHQTRVEASKKSWKNEEKRQNRLKGIKTSEKAIIARKNNWEKCLSTTQPIISKPAKQLYEYLKSKNYNVEL